MALVTYSPYADGLAPQTAENTGLLPEDKGDASVQPASMSQPEIILIADDLTGACDSSSPFIGTGRSVRVWLRPWTGEPAAAEVWAFSTETRNVPHEEAACSVAALVAQLFPHAGQSIFFKKTDSAGRGNPGVEILQALESLACDIAVFAPAFPSAGRTVQSGELRVQDRCGQVTHLPLASLFAEHSVSLRPFSGAGDDLVIAVALSGKVRVWICDAASQQDLQQLVRAVQRRRLRVLWAGAAGLAQALADALPVMRKKEALDVDRVPDDTRGTVLVMAGTTHPATQLQLARLEGRWPAQRCTLFRVQYGSTSAEDICAVWTTGQSVYGCSALVLTGGDTAALVLQALGAECLDLHGEVAPGIPWGRVHGGLADGLRVVTKSGGFGGEMTLVEIVEFLQGGGA